MARVVATARPRPLPAPEPVRQRRADLEGLCAVAVVLLVAHAARLGLSGGYIGVDVLLVIGGYLVTQYLLGVNDNRDRMSLAGDAASRAVRIFPVASLVVLATMVATAVLLTSLQLRSVAQDGLWAAISLANFHFASAGANPLDPMSPASSLQHYWALSVGAQLVLAWTAWVLLGLKLAGRGRADGRKVLAITAALFVAASVAWSLVATTADARAAFFSPLTRAWEFGAGGLLAVGAPALRRLPRVASAVLGWAGIGLIAYAAIGFDSTTAFPGWAAILPVTGAMAVVAAGAGSRRRGTEALLSSRPMAAVAACSLSLYLWHWPVLTIAEQKYPGLGLTRRLLLVGLAVVLAVATARFLERPLRRLARPAGSREVAARDRSPWRGLAVGTACVAVLLLYAQMTVVAQQAVGQRDQLLLDEEQRAASAWSVVPLATADQIAEAVEAATKITAVPGDIAPPVGLADRDVSPVLADGCLLDRGAVESPPCRFGDQEAPETVVLFGDEQAAQWLPAFIDLADRQSFGVVLLAKAECPVAQLAANDECGRWQRLALDRVAALRPKLVVASETSQLAMAAAGGESPWLDGIRSTLDRLRGSAGRVVALSETPVHARTVPDCLAGRSRDIPACGTEPAAPARPGRAVVEAAGAHFVDTQAWLCSTATCPPVIAGRVTMSDHAHLTSTYASYLSHVVGVETGLESPSQTTAPTGRATEAEVRAAVAAAVQGRQPSTSLSPPPNIAASEASPAFANGCLARREKTTSPLCQFGDLGSRRDVVLLGDSRAAQWMPALVGAAIRNQFRLTVLTKANCPAPTMAVQLVLYKRPFIECDKWREYALRRIETMRPEVVIVSSTFHGVVLPGASGQDTETERAWMAGLTTTIERLQSAGARVAVIGEGAAHAQRVPQCVEAYEQSLLPCATPASQALLVTHRTVEQEVVTGRTSASYIDSAPWFCTADTCPAVINSIITTFDESHLTATYSAYLSHVFAAATGLEP